MSAASLEPVVILTAQDARMLYQVAGLRELRNRFRVGDSRIYKLLTDISTVAFADNGNEPRQETASEERRTWTVQAIAVAARLAPRTVRLDIERSILPATKEGGTWIVDRAEAKTYIAARRKN